MMLDKLNKINYYYLIVRNKVTSSKKYSCSKLNVNQLEKVNYIEIKDSGRLAYISSDYKDNNLPGILFCPGFMKSMSTNPATVLAKFCKSQNISLTRFDYRSRNEWNLCPKDMTIGNWKNDIIKLLEQVTSGPQILVGNEMGVWLALLVAMEKPELVHAIIGVRPILDFVKIHFVKMPSFITFKKYKNYEQFYNYCGIHVSESFYQESLNHDILQRAEISVNCPIRFIHGFKDYEVSYHKLFMITEKLSSTNVNIFLTKSKTEMCSKQYGILFDCISELIRLKKV